MRPRCTTWVTLPQLEDEKFPKWSITNFCLRPIGIITTLLLTPPAPKGEDLITSRNKSRTFSIKLRRRKRAFGSQLCSCRNEIMIMFQRWFPLPFSFDGVALAFISLRFKWHLKAATLNCWETWRGNRKSELWFMSFSWLSSSSPKSGKDRPAWVAQLSNWITLPRGDSHLAKFLRRIPRLKHFHLGFSSNPFEITSKPKNSRPDFSDLIRFQVGTKHFAVFFCTDFAGIFLLFVCAKIALLSSCSAFSAETSSTNSHNSLPDPIRNIVYSTRRFGLLIFITSQSDFWSLLCISSANRKQENKQINLPALPWRSTNFYLRTRRRSKTIFSPREQREIKVSL